ncbi:hypothetical protein [Klebsiella pneumoniae]|uniref:hypothetical protein n=1 Tax=Klebsiella pneumoniae TaxID=573 RepID=UPI0022657E14|nr:hypothetical protein [Klebsiella pneumoniae]
MMTTLAALFGALPLVLSGAMALSCASRWGSPSSAVGDESAVNALHHAGGLSFL